MGKRLAILGAGNMGCAICDGIIRSSVLAPCDITLVRRNVSRLEHYKSIGCNVTDDLHLAAENADVLILAMKPQMFDGLLTEISDACDSKTVISIAAGIKTAYLKERLASSHIIRAMPNTPLTVGEGVTELCRCSDVTDDEFELAKSLFSGSGLVFECKEEEINALTALTSSAVAYFALIENAMVAWAEKNGLSSYDSRTLCDLVSKTSLGTAKLLYEKKRDPEDLIRSVASPGGTTQRALDVFCEKDLFGIFDSAMTACLKRAEELSGAK